MSQFLNASEMSCEILRKTSDGNDLAPVDLKLVKMAVNGNINELGEAALMNLYERCATGQYKKPWLHGVEHLTIDHEGYVYWKAKKIEHWTVEAADTEHWEQEAKELEARCLALEAAGVTPTTRTVVWLWPDCMDPVLVRLGSQGLDVRQFEHGEQADHGGPATGVAAVTMLCQLMAQPGGRTLDITEAVRRCDGTTPRAPYTRILEINSDAECYPQKSIKLVTEELFRLVERNVETV